MQWRKIRVYRKKEEEQKIVDRYGWPSKEARDALVTLYCHDTLRAVSRTLRGMGYGRLPTEDATHELFAHVLEVSDKWKPHLGSFSMFIEVWGVNPIGRYVARFRYPTSQGIVTASQGNVLTFEGLDRLALMPATLPPSDDMLPRVLLRSGRLTEREQQVVRLYSLGYTLSEIGEMLGVSHQRIAQLAKAVRKKVESMGILEAN